MVVQQALNKTGMLTLCEVVVVAVNDGIIVQAYNYLYKQ